MNNANLYILKDAIKLVENKVYRDYFELENLQNSSNIVKFANATLEFMKRKFYDFFKEKRPNYSLIIKDYVNEIIENNEYTIYINCISGIKNFIHAIPYFATIISIKEKDTVTTALVNNYAEKEMFYTVKGSGSFVNDKKIRVSKRSTLCNLLFAIKYDNNYIDYYSQLLPKLPLFRINNCSTLDFCNTSCGKYDCNIIFNGIKEENEIGELFITEAGGLFNYLDEEKNDCFFSNSLIFNEVKNLLNFNKNN